MNPDDIALIDRLFEGELTDRRLALKRRVRTMSSEAAAVGALGASRFHLSVAEEYKSEYRARGEVLWDTVRRVLSTSGIDVSSGALSVLQEFLLPRLVRQWQDLERDLSATLRPHGGGATIATTLTDTHTAFVDGLWARAELHLRELSAGARKSGHAVVQNFYNPSIGAIQTGDSNVAQVSLSVRSGDSAATVRALEALTEALRKSAGAEPQLVIDVSETLNDVRSEIEKPVPNRVRLAALASGAAVAIQTVASVRPAYELFRTAMLGWGIQLPIWP